MFLVTSRKLLNHEIRRDPNGYIYMVTHPSSREKLKYEVQNTFSSIYGASKQNGGFLFGAKFNKFLAAARERLTEPTIAVLIKDAQDDIVEVKGISSSSQTLPENLK